MLIKKYTVKNDALNSEVCSLQVKIKQKESVITLLKNEIANYND